MGGKNSKKHNHSLARDEPSSEREALSPGINDRHGNDAPRHGQQPPPVRGVAAAMRRPPSLHGHPRIVRPHTQLTQHENSIESHNNNVPLSRSLSPCPSAPMEQLNMNLAAPHRPRRSNSVAMPAATPTALLWRTVFNTTYDVGETCLRCGVIPMDDVEAHEAYLYIGLPALTILHCVHLSLDLPGDTLHLGSGCCLTGADVDSNELRCVLDGVPDAKHRLRQLKRTSASFRTEWSDVRRCVVAESSESVDFGDRTYPAERHVEHNGLRAAIYNIATPLTQTETFRKNFQNIMDMLRALDLSTDAHVQRPSFTIVQTEAATQPHGGGTASQSSGVSDTNAHVRAHSDGGHHHAHLHHLQRRLTLPAVRPEEIPPPSAASAAPTSTLSNAWSHVVLQRAATLGEFFVASGVLPKQACRASPDEVGLALVTAALLDTACRADAYQHGFEMLDGVRVAVAVSRRQRSLDTLLLLAATGSDEPSVDTARNVAVCVYSEMRAPILTLVGALCE
eukprot:PhM_4_TR10367/c0_g1_i1/m.27426